MCDSPISPRNALGLQQICSLFKQYFLHTWFYIVSLAKRLSNPPYLPAQIRQLVVKDLRLKSIGVSACCLLLIYGSGKQKNRFGLKVKLGCSFLVCAKCGISQKCKKIAIGIFLKGHPVLSENAILATHVFFSYHSTKLLSFNHSCQTPPRRSSTHPKPVCHFDPLLAVSDINQLALRYVPLSSGNKK